MATKKKRPRKQTRAEVDVRLRRQTGSSVSSAASQWLKQLDRFEKDVPTGPQQYPWLMVPLNRRHIHELKAICASVLSQDETRGQK